MARLKRFSFVFVLVIAGFFVYSLFTTHDPLESVVAIYLDDHLVGSGFVVAPGYIGTCNHVVRNNQKYRAVFLDGSEFTVKKAHGDYELDLAILKFGDKERPPLFFCGGDEYDDVYAIGHPNGEEFTITKGVISRVFGLNFQTDVALLPGSSGGPILRGRRVVGVTQKIKGYVLFGAAVIPVGIGYGIRGEVAREYFRAAVNILEEINE